ncbi:transcription factor IIEbeta isoform X2 [Colletes latitarsis]|uniref:transcription factor IIEbeta isoform X2 n=1 Tax=Colletes latitarsis TaxID=2605962 RepID=UPI0040374C43
MDPALLRERELFKKRALTTPTIEKKKREQEKDSTRDEPLKKKPKPSSVSSGPKLDMVNYKTMSGSTQYKFGVLAKIVKHMRARHQEGDDHPLTLEEILDETNQLDVGSKVKQWLQTEALIKNPKIEVTHDGRFMFKAMYKIKDKKSLLRLLKQQDLKGLGGILLEDIQESLPHCDKHLKTMNFKNYGGQLPLMQWTTKKLMNTLRNKELDRCKIMVPKNQHQSKERNLLVRESSSKNQGIMNIWQMF